MTAKVSGPVARLSGPLFPAQAPQPTHDGPFSTLLRSLSSCGRAPAPRLPSRASTQDRQGAAQERACIFVRGLPAAAVSGPHSTWSTRAAAPPANALFARSDSEGAGASPSLVPCVSMPPARVPWLQKGRSTHALVGSAVVCHLLAPGRSWHGPGHLRFEGRAPGRLGAVGAPKPGWGEGTNGPPPQGAGLRDSQNNGARSLAATKAGSCACSRPHCFILTCR